MADPRIKAFLDEMWDLFRKHKLCIQQREEDGPLLICELDDSFEVALYGALNTTVEDFDGV